MIKRIKILATGALLLAGLGALGHLPERKQERIRLSTLCERRKQ